MISKEKIQPNIFYLYGEVISLITFNFLALNENRFLCSAGVAENGKFEVLDWPDTCPCFIRSS